MDRTEGKASINMDNRRNTVSVSPFALLVVIKNIKNWVVAAGARLLLRHPSQNQGKGCFPPGGAGRQSRHVLSLFSCLSRMLSKAEVRWPD